ncbi:MAG: BMP family protein [Candidatus Promineifilaceae bacterium]|nr:BMP family protein [Candidatus Promineifilaceae bacterium]
MNKKYLLVIMMLLIALLAVACGGGAPAEVEEAPVEEAPAETEAPAQEETEETAEEPTEEPAAEEVEEDVSADADAAGIEPIRIAIVMPSTVTDLAWSQAIYDALLRIQEDAGGEDVVEIAFTENMFNVTDAAAAIRDYAADGYNLVIAHGTQYGTSLFEVAPDFPETSFAWGTAVDTGTEQGLENIFAYEARAEEGGYVNGVLAANLSESGVLGVVGPVEAGDAKLYIDGFLAGAKAANPDVTVNVSYTGSFGDTALAAEAANTHIQAGADVLTGSAQQVVGAIGVASEQGVPWLGTQSDQSPIAPDIVIASQLYDWDGVLLDIIEKHQAGEYGGTAYALTLNNGGLVMDIDDSLDADAVAAAEDAAAQIVAGDVDVMAAIEGVVAEAPEAGEMDEMELPEIEPVRVALVLASTTTDLAWSQSLYDSLVQLQEAYGEDVIEIAFTENMFNVTDAAAAIRDYADAGYDLVIAHGAQYGTSLFEIAPDFPDTSFAWGTTTNYGADEGVTNVFAYEPRAEQGGYVSGVLAAHLTEAGIIGLVGPVDAGDAKLHVDGFVAGVRDTDPDISMNISFTGSFGDTALAAEAANTHIQAGADVLTGSSQQVAGAIGVANERGVPWLGIQADQSPLAPDVVVATVLYDWRPTLLEMITSQQAGEMGGRVLQLTLENGGQTMIYSEGLPEDAVEAANAAEQGIIDGSIEIVADPR